MTPKQARFVQEYLIDLNATQAATRAGYSAKTAQEQGSRLLSNVMVANAVAAAQQKASERLEVTLDSIARQLDEDRTLARDKGQASAAVSASVAKAKLFGLMVERQEHTGKNGGPIEYADLSDQQLRDRLAQLEDKS